MLTAATFVACLAGCINPKQVVLQGSGTVVGRVIDATSSLPIAAATISDEVDRQAQANPDGAFSIVLPSGKHTLLVYANGYQTQRTTLTVQSKTTILISKDGYARMQPVEMQH